MSVAVLQSEVRNADRERFARNGNKFGFDELRVFLDAWF